MDVVEIISYVVALLLVAVAICYKKLYLDKKANIPTPGFFWYKKMKTSGKHLLEFVEASKAKVVYIQEGILKSSVVITHPDSAAAVLKEEETFIKDAEFFGGIRDLLDQSLVNLNGQEYKELKTAIAPAFHFNYVKQMSSVFTEKSAGLLKKWEEKAEDVLAYKDLGSFTLDTLGLAAFGVDFDCLNGKSHEYITAYKALVDFKPITDPVVEKKMKKVLLDMSDELIARKRSVGASSTPDFLDLLLTTKLSNKEMRDNVFLLFLAGSETTARSLESTLFYLATYPEMQKKAQEEVDRVLKGANPGAEEVKELPYLNMFIKEVMRIQGPVNIIASRQAVSDADVLGYHIPKGSKIGLSLNTIHHLEEFWPEHEKFDPLRFSPENSAGRHPFAYIPFSMGRRDCIGSQFSLLEQKIFLAMLLQKFTVKLSSKGYPALIPTLSVNWHAALLVNLEKRAPQTHA